MAQGKRRTAAQMVHGTIMPVPNQAIHTLEIGKLVMGHSMYHVSAPSRLWYESVTFGLLFINLIDLANNLEPGSKTTNRKKKSVLYCPSLFEYTNLRIIRNKIFVSLP